MLVVAPAQDRRGGRSPIDEEELRAAAHRNLMRFNTIATRANGGEVSVERDEILFADPHPFPFFSGVMRAHRRDDPDATIQRASRWFAERGRSFVVFARDEEDASLSEAALRSGFVEAVPRYPEMICERRVRSAPGPADLEIESVEDESAAEAFWRVCASAYPAIGFPDDAFDRFAPELLLREEVVAFLGRLGGEPVTTAMTAVLEDVGFVAWVASTERARGRGIGAAITARATNAAFDRGASFAALQASSMGESIYRRLGYRGLYSYRLLMSRPLA